MVHSINRWDRRVTCIVHPQASGIVEHDRFGGIRTEVGPAGYVVSIAEMPKEIEAMPFIRHRTERVTL